MNSIPAWRETDARVPRDEPRVRALLVSTSRKTAAAVQARLAGQPDIDFIWCAKPAKTLQTTRNVRPTVILQDLVTDAADGLQQVRACSNDDECRHIPIIALLPEGDAASRSAAFVAGVSDTIAGLPDAVEWQSRVRYHSAGFLAQQDLKRTTDELEKARDQLIRNEKMASMGLLAAGVAHEINNPVAFVTSNLNSLGEYYRDVFDVLDARAGANDPINGSNGAAASAIDVGVIREDVSQILDECRDGMSRVRKIVDNLKHFSRSGGDEWLEVDLHEEIDRALSLAHNELKYKAEVTREYGDLPLVKCVPSQLNQVFLNLLVNAAHAIEDRGGVTVSTARCAAPGEQPAAQGDDDWVRITIADTGIGMNEETCARMFEPFFTTKEIGVGTGLGLSVSFGIIRNHLGDIDVASEPGKGTAITVFLPVNHESDRAAADE